jgi:hypothetical protein
MGSCIVDSMTASDITPAATPALVCALCGEELEREGRTLVTVRSGDDGGTYDICEGNWKEAEQRLGGHRVAK